MMFNAMSDMAVAMVIILISILLIMIASLCIRLTFLATIDEDIKRNRCYESNRNIQKRYKKGLS